MKMQSLLSDFFTPLVLPVSKQTVNVKQLSTKTFLQLQKYLIENNNNLAEQLFTQVIQQCINEDINVSHLTCIDKLACLLKIRSISCGNNIKIANGENIQGIISMENVLEQLYIVDLNVSKIISLNNDVSIEIGLPNCLGITEIDHIFEQVIKNIIFKHEIIDCNHLNVEQIKECLQYIQASNTTSHIIDFVNNQNLNIIAFKGCEKLKLYDIIINPFNDSIIEFCKFIFKSDLMSEYRSIYILSSKSHLPPDFLMSIPPVECQIYLRMLADEAEQNNMQLNDKDSAVNIPTPPIDYGQI